MTTGILKASGLRSFCTAALLGAAASVQAAGLIIPLYGNTTAQFNAAVSAAQKVSTIAVINPDNGPGSSKVAGIRNQVIRLGSAGARVAGYVNTFYGGEALNDVYSQMDAYRTWYGCNAVYLDEMSDSTGKVGYYRSIYTYAHKKGMTVVGNPGTFVPSSYSSVADVLVTFEDPASRWASARQVSWAAPASKLAAIIYGVSAGSMQSYVDKAVARRYGWIFVTDGSGGNPFGRAPSYLQSEASYIKSKK